MIQGVSFLHNMRSPVVHGDFKPSDVLLTAKEGDNITLFNGTVSREFLKKNNS
jgi:serine/threonine protein kinase